MNPVQFDRPGVWRELFAAALTLTDHLATVIQEPTWSFGGGTVLMLRLNHRHSKDIDLFVCFARRPMSAACLGRRQPHTELLFATRHFENATQVWPVRDAGVSEGDRLQKRQSVGQHREFVFVYRRERVKNFDGAPAIEYRRIGTMNKHGLAAGA